MFAELAGGGGTPRGGEREVYLVELRDACARLGYHLDEELLRTVFARVDEDHSSGLNVHEFLVLLCLVHILKVRLPARPAAPLLAASASPPGAVPAACGALLAHRLPPTPCPLLLERRVPKTMRLWIRVS